MDVEEDYIPAFTETRLQVQRCAYDSLTPTMPRSFATYLDEAWVWTPAGGDLALCWDGTFDTSNVVPSATLRLYLEDHGADDSVSETARLAFDLSPLREAWETDPAYGDGPIHLRFDAGVEHDDAWSVSALYPSGSDFVCDPCPGDVVAARCRCAREGRGARLTPRRA